MKFLTSIWGLLVIGILLSIATTAAMFYAARDSFSQPLPGKPVDSSPRQLWSFRPDEVDKLIAELGIERKRLEAREVDLKKLESQIAAERVELEKAHTEIETAKGELTAAVGEVQEGEAKNIKTLAQTYSTIAPAAAVTIFAQMDDMMVVKILSFMKADKVGAVFGEMAHSGKDDSMAKRAARISDRLRVFKSLKIDAPQP